MEYIVTVKNPSNGQIRRITVEANTTGQALANIGKIPEGFAIDSVSAAEEDLAPPPLLVEDEPLAGDELAEIEEDRFIEEDSQFEYEPPPGYAQHGRPSYRSSNSVGHSTGTLVFVWIFGALVGGGAFWMLQPFIPSNSSSTNPLTSNTRPAQPQGNNTTPTQSSPSTPTFTQDTSSPVVTSAAREDDLSGTVWGLDQGDEVPLAIWRVTGQDPQTRFLYEALVAADTEPEARILYEEWSPNRVVKIERVAWLRGSPDGSEP